MTALKKKTEYGIDGDTQIERKEKKSMSYSRLILTCQFSGGNGK